MDPVGGAWAIEDKTDQVETDARMLLDKIERQGGTLSAIQKGFIQREIQESAYKAQQEIDNKSTIVVGVNRFTTEENTPIESQRIDPAIETEQKQRVASVRKSRDQRSTSTALTEVENAARMNVNLVPSIVDAVEAKATVGEISHTLRKVFGEHTEIS